MSLARWTEPLDTLKSAAIEPNRFLGIDPGLSGALAILSETGTIISVEPMPPTPKDIAEYLESFIGSIRMAMLEKVWLMPNQRPATGFIENYGILQGILTALRIPFELVPPQRWQKGLNCPKRDNTKPKSHFKNQLKARAQSMFPELKITLKTADSLLIAEYARRMNQ